MRTTLEIDDSVLAAARASAADSGTSVGAALSDPARRGLQRGPAPHHVTNGIPVFAAAPDARPIALELVNEHRDG